jgi:hypothetical protein
MNAPRLTIEALVVEILASLVWPVETSETAAGDRTTSA